MRGFESIVSGAGSFASFNKLLSASPSLTGMLLALSRSEKKVRRIGPITVRIAELNTSRIMKEILIARCVHEENFHILKLLQVCARKLSICETYIGGERCNANKRIVATEKRTEEVAEPTVDEIAAALYKGWTVAVPPKAKRAEEVAEPTVDEIAAALYKGWTVAVPPKAKRAEEVTEPTVDEIAAALYKGWTVAVPP
ncbi:hypothetical protein M7I_6020 [Glarea lozoyensis 74030]|uniref:Uncharacterized protein n=1 Tax=Glarea lozoyensis (strain ATCC 74030 / MF5533) TaxID=1104152 RepID=H0ETF8_GLAL7|nr:hypothetical protein M7I_6020 [Glarea lozoyensis 74030]